MKNEQDDKKDIICVIYQRPDFYYTEFMKQVLKWYTRLFMFLFPVFFLPVVVDSFGTGKNLFIAISALVGLILWVADMLISKKNTVKVNGFWGVGVLFLVWSLVTWFFEPVGVRMSSLMAPLGLTTVVSAVIWMFLWMQVTDKEEYKKQFNFVMASGVLVAITSLIVFLIPSSKFPIQLPKGNPIIALTAGWSLTGSLLSELVLFLFLGIEWVKRLLAKLKPTEINAGDVEVKVKIKIDYLKEAIAVVLFGLVLCLDIYRIVKTGWFYLDIVSAWSIAVESLKVSPILGVGIGNFVEAFNQFRPLSFNLTNNWGSTFTGSSVGILNIWTETGLIGLAMIVWATLMLKKKRKTTSFWQIAVLWVALLVLPLNIMGLFLVLWLIIGNLFANKEIKLILNVGENKFNAMPLVVGVLTLGVVGYCGWNITKILIGDIIYRQSLVAASKNDGSATYNLEIKAITNWNPYSAEYRRMYSQTNLALAETYLSNKDISDEDKQKASTLVQQAVREAKSAVSLDPKNPIYWNNLAVIYKNLIGLVDDAATWSYQAYAEAVVFDPINPLLKLDMGGLLYAAESYDEADRIFQQAVESKSNYANAWYNWAYSAKKRNYLSDAVTRLTKAVDLVSAESGDYDQASKELDTWKKELEEATKKQQDALKQQQAETEKKPETLVPPAEKMPEATNSARVVMPTGTVEAPIVTPTVAPVVSPTMAPQQ